MVKAIILSLFIPICCSVSFTGYAAFPLPSATEQLQVQVATMPPSSDTDEHPASEKRGRLLGVMSLAFGILAFIIMAVSGAPWVIIAAMCLLLPGIVFGLMGHEKKNKLALAGLKLNIIILLLLLLGLSMDSWYHVF